MKVITANIIDNLHTETGNIQVTKYYTLIYHAQLKQPRMVVDAMMQVGRDLIQPILDSINHRDETDD
jgi:hypothetical protein